MQRTYNGGMPPLRKTTLNFVAPAWAAAERIAQARGLSLTDAINRAVQFYDLALQAQAEGGDLLIRRPDGQVERIIDL